MDLSVCLPIFVSVFLSTNQPGQLVIKTLRHNTLGDYVAFHCCLQDIHLMMFIIYVSINRHTNESLSLCNYPTSFLYFCPSLCC